MLAGKVVPRSLVRWDAGFVRLNVDEGSGLSLCLGPQPPPLYLSLALHLRKSPTVTFLQEGSDEG